MTCAVDECENTAVARGWCPKHWWRWRHHGSATWEPPRMTLGDMVRKRIGPGLGDDECWPWLGAMQRNGYGFLTVNGRTVRAHRASYEVFVGPIPEGMEIDHRCRNRACVNPAHLRPLTSAANKLRGADHPNRQKTHCKNGHEFTPENTRIRRGTDGNRDCRACQRERQEKRRAS